MSDYQYPLVIFIKSFSRDIQLCSRLLESIAKHNLDKIPVILSVPKKDVLQFKKIIPPGVMLVSDESYARAHFCTIQYWGLPLGYLNQEICKLTFWKSGIAENYFCIDSDSLFFKDFYYDDFLHPDGAPYTILVEDKDLQIRPEYQQFGAWRLELIRRIFSYFNLPIKHITTSHGIATINSRVLQSLEQSFLAPLSLKWHHLLCISPYEFSWYNAWLIKSKQINIHAVEPFLKTYHTQSQYYWDRVQSIGIPELRTHYLGIVLNSNWNRTMNLSRYFSPIYQLIKHRIRASKQLVIGWPKGTSDSSAHSAPTTPSLFQQMPYFLRWIETFTNLKIDSFMEIGAHKGEDAKLVQEYLQLDPSKIIVVEPHPIFFQELCHNSRYRVFPQAFSNKMGKVKFHISDPSDQNTGVSSLLLRADSTKLKTVEVESIPAETFFRVQKIRVPDFIKIDVEGHTKEVLQGFGSDLQRAKVIHLETEHDKVWKNQSLHKDCVEILEKSGFVQAYYQRYKSQADSLWIQKRYLQKD